MRGLFVISSLSEGGAQRILSNLLLSIPEDWDIDLLLNDDGPRDYPYKGKILTLGLPEEKDKKRLSYQFKVFVRRYIQLWKLKRLNKFDFCISFLDSANLVNVLTKAPGIRTILSVHNYLSEACSRSIAHRFLLAPLIRHCYNRADLLIAVSCGVKDDLVKNFGVDEALCSVVYNGVNIYAGKKLERKDKSFIITTMGRLEEQKGQWHLIRVVALLASKYPQLRLIILGEGSLRALFEGLISRLGLEDRVSLPGFIKQPMDTIANSDLFVFPSLYEGFGNALVEAMSCGVPVISSDYYSGAREILAPVTEKKITEGIEWAKYGCLVPVSGTTIEEAENLESLDEGEKSLYLAIEQMITDEHLRREYGEKAARRAADFSKEKMIQGWMKEIYRVCEKTT